MYSPLLRAQLENPATTPLELMGFFHNLPWDTPLAYDDDEARWRLAAAGDTSSSSDSSGDTTTAASSGAAAKTLLEYIQDGACIHHRDIIEALTLPTQAQGSS
eukprot:COSAG06_NODE_17524_length_936_cov_1.990442_1_plen_103_part_00